MGNDEQRIRNDALEKIIIIHSSDFKYDINTYLEYSISELRDIEVKDVLSSMNEELQKLKGESDC
jgi:hypothetical protein